MRRFIESGGLAFADDTLYLAESDQVDSFSYRAGALSEKKVVVDGLPDAKSPELGGAYAHALKSVAIGKDGALYVSVGSTGNISAEDRDASPERASILRVPPGGGEPAVYARGVRNGTGLAIDPDGWFHTGDIGAFDADGYLRITDRKKDLLVLSNGKKVAPQPIENALRISPLIEQAVVIGDGRSYVGALIIPAFEAIRRALAPLTFADRAALCDSEAARALIDAELARVNENLAAYEKIKRFVLVRV